MIKNNMRNDKDYSFYIFGIIWAVFCIVYIADLCANYINGKKNIKLNDYCYSVKGKYSKVNDLCYYNNIGFSNISDLDYYINTGNNKSLFCN